MNLEQRIKLLVQLGHYMLSEDDEWMAAKQRASSANKWFIPEFIDVASKNIAEQYLKPERLEELVAKYGLADNLAPKKVGIVMAGNIPMVGFHDLMCVFITGNIAIARFSSKDDVLIPFFMKKMAVWNPASPYYLQQVEILKDCDGYIATGSNNSAVHFEYYFRNHPHIIRKNRTSVAILTGNETKAELEALADDVHLFFGLGCRNVTKIFVPNGYDFEPLLMVFEKYHRLINFGKYKNNYDYNLALHILNKREYMTNGSLLLLKDASLFSPISQLHYETYDDLGRLQQQLQANDQIQAIVGKNDIDFGASQCPGICQFADGVDTIKFLLELENSSEKEIRKS